MAEMYTIDEDVLAQMVAAHTSGLPDANADASDYEMARKIIFMIDNRYDDLPDISGVVDVVSKHFS